MRRWRSRCRARSSGRWTLRRHRAGLELTKVYLSGGTAKIPALFKTIEARVGVPVEIMNPFKNIEIDNRKFDPGFIMDVAPVAAVAVGLALRKPGDKLG
jgi:type IV pilus assembly protein PilM